MYGPSFQYFESVWLKYILSILSISDPQKCFIISNINFPRIVYCKKQISLATGFSNFLAYSFLFFSLISKINNQY